MKFILSLGVIIVFALFAMASLSSSSSSNTTIGVIDCKVMPEVSNTLKVYVYLHEEDGTPVPNAQVNLFLNHQDIVDTVSCVIGGQAYEIDLTTGSDGRVFFNDLSFTHNNESDLWRGEVIYEKTAAYDRKRMVNAAVYDDDDMIFNVTMIKLGDL